MAKPLIPLVRSGGFYSSRRLTPLVYRGGFTRRGSEDFEPVEKTVSGAIVTVADALEMPAKSVIVAIEPVQAGSGDPSPENVRPITGWTGANIYHSGADTSNPDVISITFPSEAGTVYGGTLDLVAGKLVVDRAMVDMGTLMWNRNAAKDGKYRMQTNDLVSVIVAPSTNNDLANIICSRYKTISANDVYGRTIGIGVYASGYVAVYDEDYSDGTSATIAAFATAVSGAQLVYELATPIIYDLTPQEIAMFRGANTLWANTGDITLTYLADGN